MARATTPSHYKTATPDFPAAISKNLIGGEAMYKKIPLAAVLFCAAFGSHAASFDCGKAATLVEKAICSDPALSNLDDSLTQTYQTALENSGDADSLKTKQKTWLNNVRNKCPDVACLKQAYGKRIAKLSAAPAAELAFPDLNTLGGRSPQDIFKHKRLNAALKKLVGKYYDLLQTNLSVSAGNSINTAGALETEGCAPHVCNSEDAKLYIEKSGGIYVAIHTEDKILYFTTEAAHESDPIYPIAEFIKQFPDAKLMIISH